MYSDVMSYCVSCPQCAVVNAAARVNRPLLHPISVSQPFEKFNMTAYCRVLSTSNTNIT